MAWKNYTDTTHQSCHLECSIAIGIAVLTRLIQRCCWAFSLQDDNSRCRPARYCSEQRCLTLACPVMLRTRCIDEVSMISAGTQDIGRPHSTGRGRRRRVSTPTPSPDRLYVSPDICNLHPHLAHIRSRSGLDALRETLSQMSNSLWPWTRRRPSNGWASRTMQCKTLPVLHRNA